MNQPLNDLESTDFDLLDLADAGYVPSNLIEDEDDEHWLDPHMD